MVPETLRKAVRQAHKEVAKAGLVEITWGSASGVNRDGGVMALWPPGIADADNAVESGIVLEPLSRMAPQSYILNPNARPIDQALLDKHLLRRHGAGAYHGQSKS